MSYTKTVWKDLPDETTPVNATNLNHIENGIKDTETLVGDLTGLTTTEKTDVVSAVNEVVSSVSDVSTDLSNLTSIIGHKVAGILITRVINSASWTSLMSLTLPAGVWYINAQMNAAAQGLASTIRLEGVEENPRQSVYYPDSNTYSNNLSCVTSLSSQTTINVQAWSATGFSATDVLCYARRLK